MHASTLCNGAFFLVFIASLAFGQDPTATTYWRSSFENGFPGEWLNYDNGTWTASGVPNPGSDAAWTIVDGSGVPCGAIHGQRVYKGWILDSAGESHRAYPCIHCDYASPLVNSWWVWLDTDYANFPSGGWHHFGTWCNNPDWDVHTMSVIRNGRLEMAHVDSFEVLGNIDMPLRTWVRFTVYVEYAPAGSNLIVAWMDSTPVMRAKNIKGGGGNLMRAHWGLYASGNLFEGVQYNDDIQIWGLSGPWTDFSRVPPSPYDSIIAVINEKEVRFCNGITIQSLHRGVRIEVTTTRQKGTGQLNIWNINGRLVTRCMPSSCSDRSTVFEWDGNNAHGVRVSPGTYIASFRIGSFFLSRIVSLTL
ncbi:MAG: hypothetical protein JW768_13150 [Chitinispirillaceae bacterium]|nr:hypothetical protein [Chitinispirillaceae bacterium]